MPFEGFPQESKDEFAGMDAEALRENILLQEQRIASGIVDTADKYEIEDLIERMRARIEEMKG